MPINEILAPFYSIAKYTTPAYSLGHRVRLYFDEMPVITATEVTFPTYTDAGHATGWTLDEIWSEVVERAAVDGGMGQLLFANVEMWESASGENIFRGFDAADYSSIVGGVSVGAASAYLMWVFQTALRDQFRLTFFDSINPAPQRYAVATPPASDDGTLEWLFINSAIGFCNQDGNRIRLCPSINSGYNRGLAKRYGRNVIP